MTFRDRISELSDHVARLKGLTIDIGNEAKEQNRLLDNVSDGFSSTKDFTWLDLLFLL